MEKYFDYQWHECQPEAASFYSLITLTDSGWHRRDYFVHNLSPQMFGTYEDSGCKVSNGMFYHFFPDKQLENYGQYKHGKKQGVWLSYHANGMISDSVTYDNGREVGIAMAWYPNGFLQDSISWQNDGSGTGYYWFDDGSVAAAGRFKNWANFGKWQYFHPNGKISSLELYDSVNTFNDSGTKVSDVKFYDSTGKLTALQLNGKTVTFIQVRDNLVAKQYFDETGAPVDTAGRDHQAQFPGGYGAWQKYLAKHLYFPEQYKITNADKAVTVISFTVGADGKVKDAFVSTPFVAQFDKIALDAIKRSPDWIAAVQHNRKVPYYQRQAVFFSQARQ